MSSVVSLPWPRLSRCTTGSGCRGVKGGARPAASTRLARTVTCSRSERAFRLITRGRAAPCAAGSARKIGRAMHSASETVAGRALSASQCRRLLCEGQGGLSKTALALLQAKRGPL
jgi:hypothetical protein